MIKCKDCKKQMWKLVISLHHIGIIQCNLYQCQICKRVVASNTMNGEGEI